MQTESGTLEVYDFAEVTSLGIMYHHICYTCSKAIRERWFELALIDVSWNIRIRFKPADMRFIYIQTETGEFEECRAVVRDPLQGFELENYLHAVQLMKLAKKIINNRNE